MDTSSDTRVRAAGPGDVEALVELRALMFAAMDVPGVDDPQWRIEALQWFGTRVSSDDVHVQVVDVDGAVVAMAMGCLRDSAPSPTSPSGGDVLVSNVVVRPEHRRRGHARRVLRGVLSWAADRGIARVELVATGQGRSLYEALGFRESRFPLMRLHPRAEQVIVGRVSPAEHRLPRQPT
ncbi:GNAT family N-acetyltransferase [Aquipuribacter nitratireducens]|uniref:GNAT family N-acetyltransferase n=1 Tax=Aquipuribacter nitratireducens TaxID=650104 RepID=A0ABW0GPZ5_9MICO